MSKFPNIGNFGIHGGPEMKELRERVNKIMNLFSDCFNDKERHKDIDGLREKAMNIVNEYLTAGRAERALRLIEYKGDDHKFLKSNGIDMRDCYNLHDRNDKLREKVMMIVNHYRTPNLEQVNDRVDEFLVHTGGRGTKCYNINKIKFFRDIPDGIEILIDYVDVTAIRTMNIPTEIVYESIYRHLPELFEE